MLPLFFAVDFAGLLTGGSSQKRDDLPDDLNPDRP
jgi:hypothetical protein